MLVVTALGFGACNVAAQNAPVQFQGMKAASLWFDKVYPSHEMKHYTIKMPEGSSAQVYAIYGPRGSGIGQLDGWFYGCVNGSSCSLLAMATLGSSREIKEDPLVTYDPPYLVVKSGSNILLRVKLR